MFDELYEQEKRIDEKTAKVEAIRKQCDALKLQKLCYCKEFKEYLAMFAGTRFSSCDVCISKLQDDEDWHYKASFLKKSWAEDSIDPGP